MTLASIGCALSARRKTIIVKHEQAQKRKR